MSVAVIYEYDPAHEDDRLGLRPQHRDFLGTLLDKEQLIAAGAWPDGSGALLLFNGEDTDATLALLDSDPYLAAGVVAKRVAHIWNPPIGSL